MAHLISNALSLKFIIKTRLLEKICKLYVTQNLNLCNSRS